MYDVKNTIPENLIWAVEEAEERLAAAQDAAEACAPGFFDDFQYALSNADEETANERVPRASRRPGHLLEILEMGGYANCAAALGEYGAASWAADAADRETIRYFAGGFIPVSEESGLQAAQAEAHEKWERSRKQYAFKDGETVARIKGQRLLANRRKKNMRRWQEATEFMQQRDAARKRYADRQQSRHEEWERQRRDASERSRLDRIRWAASQRGGEIPQSTMTDEERERAAAHERSVWKREQTAEILRRMDEVCAMPYHEDPSLAEAGSPLARITPKKLEIIAYLLEISADTSTIWASQETVARATGTSRSTVYALMRELEAAGVLRRIKTGGKNLLTGRTASNVYRFHQQRLRELLGIKLRGRSKYALPKPDKLHIGIARAEEEARCAASGYPIPHNPFHSSDGMVTGRCRIAGFLSNRYRRCWWNLARDLDFYTVTLTGKRTLENQKSLIQVFYNPTNPTGGARRAAKTAKRLQREEARRKAEQAEAFLSSWPNADRKYTIENDTSEPLSAPLSAETLAYDPDPKWLRELAILDKELADELVSIATPMSIEDWNNLDTRMKHASSLVDVHALAADLAMARNGESAQNDNHPCYNAVNRETASLTRVNRLI